VLSASRFQVAFGAVPLVLGLKSQDWMYQDWERCHEYYSKRKLHIWADQTDFLYNMWERFLRQVV
jgi:hypothetical protein